MPVGQDVNGFGVAETVLRLVPYLQASVATGTWAVMAVKIGVGMGVQRSDPERGIFLQSPVPTCEGSRRKSVTQFFTTRWRTVGVEADVVLSPCDPPQPAGP
jgi:hypothetical protein